MDASSKSTLSRRSPAAGQKVISAPGSGYLYLLACQWQTDDCSISADPLDLAEMSGLGDELWAIHGPRILRKFDVAPCGKLTNPACRRADEVLLFEGRKTSADRTNEHRWSNGHRSVTDGGPNRSADTRTGTVWICWDCGTSKAYSARQARGSGM